MARIVKGSPDRATEALVEALSKYESEHSGSEAAVYRQNPGSVRVRIIDDRFAGMPRSRRHDDVWQFLTRLVGDDVMSEVSTLLLIPTVEIRSSLANLDFEDPQPSHL